MQNQRKRGKKTSLKGDTELFSCVTTESLWDMLLSSCFHSPLTGVFTQLF